MGIKSNPMLSRMYRNMKLADACELHQRLQEGRFDQSTRNMIHFALKHVNHHQVSDL